MHDILGRSRGVVAVIIQQASKEELLTFINKIEDIKSPDSREFHKLVDDYMRRADTLVSTEESKDRKLVYRKVFELFVRMKEDLNNYKLLQSQVRDYYDMLPLNTKALCDKVGDAL